MQALHNLAVICGRFGIILSIDRVVRTIHHLRDCVYVTAGVRDFDFTEQGTKPRELHRF